MDPIDSLNLEYYKQQSIPRLQEWAKQEKNQREKNLIEAAIYLKMYEISISALLDSAWRT